MQLWFAITISLHENENEKCIHIIHNWWCPTINKKKKKITIGNVVHKWLNNMWHFVQVELPRYNKVANAHVLMAN